MEVNTNREATREIPIILWEPECSFQSISPQSYLSKIHLNIVHTAFSPPPPSEWLISILILCQLFSILYIC
jgi:hypothetical protein